MGGAAGLNLEFRVCKGRVYVLGVSRESGDKTPM